MKCPNPDCDFDAQCRILDGPLVLQTARSGSWGQPYPGKLFAYCPWCGQRLVDEPSPPEPR